MRIAVSNIAWDAASDDAVLGLLPGLGVDAVEVAPTRLWPDWNGATAAGAAIALRDLQNRHLTCSSMQALLFGRPDLRLFGTVAEREALIAHLERVADLA